ncbi:MAG: hypothetical protein U0414_15015 [Polyangiaceae bacterium]
MAGLLGERVFLLLTTATLAAACASAPVERPAPAPFEPSAASVDRMCPDLATAACLERMRRIEARALFTVSQLPITTKGFVELPRVKFISDESTVFIHSEKERARAASFASDETAGDGELRGAVIDEVQSWQSGTYDFWLLRQSHFGHGLYGIFLDRTASPPVAVYLRLFEADRAPVLRGASCYECHPSGPRVMRPLIPASTRDAASLALRLSTEDQARIEEWNERIVGYGEVATLFPSSEPHVPSPLVTDGACTRCHARGGTRAALEQGHAAAIQYVTHAKPMSRYFVFEGAAGPDPIMPPPPDPRGVFVLGDLAVP